MPRVDHGVCTGHTQPCANHFPSPFIQRQPRLTISRPISTRSSTLPTENTTSDRQPMYNGTPKGDLMFHSYWEPFPMECQIIPSTLLHLAGGVCRGRARASSGKQPTQAEAAMYPARTKACSYHTVTYRHRDVQADPVMKHLHFDSACKRFPQ
jgi:hypothetical protein